MVWLLDEGKYVVMKCIVDDNIIRRDGVKGRGYDDDGKRHSRERKQGVDKKLLKGELIN